MLALQVAEPRMDHAEALAGDRPGRGEAHRRCEPRLEAEVVREAGRLVLMRVVVGRRGDAEDRAGERQLPDVEPDRDGVSARSAGGGGAVW